MLLKMRARGDHFMEVVRIQRGHRSPASTGQRRRLEMGPPSTGQNQWAEGAGWWGKDEFSWAAEGRRGSRVWKEVQRQAWKCWGWALIPSFLGKLKGQEGPGCVIEQERASSGRRCSGAQGGNREATGPELDVDREEGPTSVSHHQC